MPATTPLPLACYDFEGQVEIALSNYLKAAFPLVNVIRSRGDGDVTTSCIQVVVTLGEALDSDIILRPSGESLFPRYAATVEIIITSERAIDPIAYMGQPAIDGHSGLRAAVRRALSPARVFATPLPLALDFHDIAGMIPGPTAIAQNGQFDQSTLQLTITIQLKGDYL